MRRYLRKYLFVLVALALLFSLGCSAPLPTGTSSSIEIVDQLGRTVKLDKLPQRIISLAPSNTEILYALGLGDKVVGVTDYDDYPPEVKQKPSIGGYSDPSVEKIVSLSPDLVVADSIDEKDIIPQLEKDGITVLALNPKTLDDVLAAINMVGKVTGTSQKASELVAQMQSRIKAVTDKTDKLTPGQRPKVMYIVWNDPLMVAGGGTFLDELITKAGGVNVFGNLKDYPTISLEAVIQANPDIILAGVSMGAGGNAPLTFAQTNPELRDVSARKADPPRVYSIDSDVSGRAGPRIVDVLEEFAKNIHPELFK